MPNTKISRAIERVTARAEKVQAELAEVQEKARQVELDRAVAIGTALIDAVEKNHSDCDLSVRDFYLSLIGASAPEKDDDETVSTDTGRHHESEQGTNEQNNGFAHSYGEGF